MSAVQREPLTYLLELLLVRRPHEELDPGVLRRGHSLRDQLKQRASQHRTAPPLLHATTHPDRLRLEPRLLRPRLRLLLLPLPNILIIPALLLALLRRRQRRREGRVHQEPRHFRVLLRVCVEQLRERDEDRDRPVICLGEVVGDGLVERDAGVDGGSGR